MIDSLATVIPEVKISDNRAVTTSLAVAEYFQKRHDDVLRKIRLTIGDCDPAYHLRNFTEMFQDVEVAKGAVRKTPYFELTRDAFVLIVMGFTGKKALRWKIDYITAFNEMEAEIARRNTQPPAPAVMPIFPANSDFDLYTCFRNGAAVSARIVPQGKVLMDSSDACAMLKRMGIIPIHHSELRFLAAPEIIALCDNAAREEARQR
ncbi:Rha family transcriptional regulator [Citrobacter sp. ANG330]|uniref:Rha family transcriptional regulator n=1 Tax=Citrobacter sp. ANG330 TaxID=3048142 RepID=UPI0039C1A616